MLLHFVIDVECSSFLKVPAQYVHSFLKSYLRITSSSKPLSTELKWDFEYFYSLSNLLSQLFAIFGWVDNNQYTDHTQKGVSIFTGPSKGTSSQKPSPGNYKTRSDFGNDFQYENYIKSVIKPGMRVKARQRYKSVKRGELGEFRRCNTSNSPSRTPSAQVYWDSLKDTCWVFWYHLEIVGDSITEEKSKLVGVV